MPRYQFRNADPFLVYHGSALEKMQNGSGSFS